MRIMLIANILVQGKHLQGTDMQSFPFEACDYFTDEPSLYRAGLDDDKCPFKFCHDKYLPLLFFTVQR